MDTISVSAALQIGGRAGRYGTQWENGKLSFLHLTFFLFYVLFITSGFVTTFKEEDLHTLKGLMTKTPDPLTQAGLHPTADQIELYAYHLPNSTLSNLIVSL